MIKRKRWTNEEIERIGQLRADGHLLEAIAGEFGVSANSVRHVYARRGSGYIEVPRVYTNPVKRPRVDAVLRLPPPIFDFKVPFVSADVFDNEPIITAVLYGDTHYPFDDPRAMEVVKGVVRDAHPNVLVHMGDLVDCYSISRFERNPSRLLTLQDEIDAGKQHLAEMALVAPQAHRLLLEGNHEDRLRRTIWNLQGAPRALATLDVFKQALTWPRLLDLDSIGWEWVGRESQARKATTPLPKFLLKHGEVIRKHAAYSARGEWERYGTSGASGHTHRMGLFTHSDHNGTHQWVETGCTCTLEPEYMYDPDWHQGLVVATFERSTGAVGIEFVKIHEGHAIWRERVYSAGDDPVRGRK